MALLRVEAIVLGGSDFGEADRVLSLLTREEGRVRAVAKGVRRGRSRLASLLEPLSLLSLVLFPGKNLDRITGASPLATYREIREDLVRLAVGSYAAELFDLALPERSPDPGAFDLLERFLAELRSFPDPEMLLRALEFRLLSQQGYHPESDRCVICGGELGAEIGYDAEAGGFLCRRCRRPGQEVQGAVRSVVRHFLASGRSLRNLRLAEPTRRDLEKIIRESWRLRLGREIRAGTFLYRVLHGPASLTEPSGSGTVLGGDEEREE